MESEECRFPHEKEDLLTKWINHMKDDTNFKLNENSRICEFHFERSCFVTYINGTKRLKVDAIPTINLRHQINDSFPVEIPVCSPRTTTVQRPETRYHLVDLHGLAMFIKKATRCGKCFEPNCLLMMGNISRQNPPTVTRMILKCPKCKFDSYQDLKVPNENRNLNAPKNYPTKLKKMEVEAGCPQNSSSNSRDSFGTCSSSSTNVNLAEDPLHSPTNCINVSKLESNELLNKESLKLLNKEQLNHNNLIDMSHQENKDDSINLEKIWLKEEPIDDQNISDDEHLIMDINDGNRQILKIEPNYFDEDLERESPPRYSNGLMSPNYDTKIEYNEEKMEDSSGFLKKEFLPDIFRSPQKRMKTIDDNDEGEAKFLRKLMYLTQSFNDEIINRAKIIGCENVNNNDINENLKRPFQID